MVSIYSFPITPVISDIEIRAQATRRVWSNYVNKGIKLGHVRSVVFDSWKRSREYGVNPKMTKAPVVLAEREINEKKKNYEELLSLIRPFMYDLYEIVKGTDSVLAFSDSSGIVMELFGDYQIVLAAGSVNFKVGVDMKESVVGGNAIGTSLQTGTPVQMFAAEHYSRLFHESSCSSAPIKDPLTNQNIGNITIVGYYNSAHPHSLALVTTAANTINRLIQQKSLENETFLLNNFFAAAMDSISDGMLIVNRYGEVLRMNGVARHLLKIPLQTDCKSLFHHFGHLEPLKRFIVETVAGSDVITQKEYQTAKEDKFSLIFTSRRIMINESTIGAIVILKKKTLVEIQKRTAKYTFDSLIGASKPFMQAVHLAKRAAQTDKSVLLLGESGTGKELFAQAIHNASPRAEQRFVAINCAAIPRELMASELFGYTEGSFTGAAKGGKRGKFEEADGGTVFLDEIGDMPLELQAYLLRVLEEREVTPIGSGQPKPVDIRIIAATHKDLHELIKKGEFRLDLFYRLNVIQIEIPALRQRMQDIPLFIAHELPNKTIDPKVMQMFYRYDWPGNLRELRNVLEQIEIFNEDELVTGEYVPQYIKNRTEEAAGHMPLYKMLTKETEKESIVSVLQSSANVAEAAEKLGVSISTMYRWINKFGINAKDMLK